MIKQLIAKIKLVWSLRNAIKNIKGVYSKMGIKSTEFWVTVVTWLSVLGSAALGMIKPEMTAMILTGLAVIYTIARSVVKMTTTTKDDELLDKFEQILKEKGLLK